MLVLRQLLVRLLQHIVRDRLLLAARRARVMCLCSRARDFF